MCLLLFCRLSSANAQTTGIAVERMFLQSGPSAFFQVQGAEVAAPSSLWLHSAVLLLSSPLVLRHRYTGELLAVPVKHRVTLDVGGELGLWKQRLSMTFGLPVALWQDGDRLQNTGGTDDFSTAPLRASAVGDIRLGLKMRLTAPHLFWGFLTAFEATIPGGGQTDFVATDGMTVSPKLAGFFRKGFVSAALEVAARLAPLRKLYETTLQHSVEWGAAVSGAVPVPRVGLAFIGEAVGAYNVAGAISSTELRGGGRLAAGTWALDVGAGGGFGPLSPPWRVFVSFRVVFQKREPAFCPHTPVAL